MNIKKFFTLEKSKTPVGRLLILSISWFLLLASIFVLSVFITEPIDEFFWVYLLFLVPLMFSFLYAIFYKKKWMNIVAKVIFPLLLIIYFIIIALFYNDFIYDYYYYWQQDTLYFLIPFGLIIFITLRLYWKSLKSFVGLLKENKKLQFVMTMISIVLIFSLYMCIKVSNRLYVYNRFADDWGSGLDTISINSVHSIAIQKMALFAGIIFVSTFLILKALKKDK